MVRDAPLAAAQVFRQRIAKRRVWPPMGIEDTDPWHLPLLTLILLTSGTTVTTHRAARRRPQA